MFIFKSDNFDLVIYDGEKYVEVIGKIKTQIPNAILRTRLIVGFPGETEEDFEDLKDFISKVEFDHLGVFAFSDEEDTFCSIRRSSFY